MTPDEAQTLVRSYYAAYQLDTSEDVTGALARVLDPDFVLESPVVEVQLGGPARGQAAFAAAAGVAPFLQNADVEALYTTPDGSGVVALIRFPSPVGPIEQSEHFDVDPRSGRLTRLRSYYDPTKLLALLKNRPA